MTLTLVCAGRWFVVVAACWAATADLHAPTWARSTPGAGHRRPISPPPGVTVSWTPAESELWSAADESAPAADWLFSAALAASGVSQPAQTADYRRRLNAWVDELRLSASAQGDERAQAEAIFGFMHRRILTGGYQVDQTNLDVAIDTGAYNCVSSAVVFNVLADRFGLRVHAVQVGGHAYSELLTREGPVEIETTCPRWFQTLGDARRQRELVERTTGSRHRRGDAAMRRTLSAPALVAVIYYNHGVDRLRRREFEQAVTANLKSLRLDPASESSRGNLLAALNNWSLQLSEQREFEAAVRLLRHGAAEAPDHATFQVNLVAVHQQWVNDLSSQRRYSTALDLLDRAAIGGLGHEYLAAATLDVCRKQCQELAKDGRLDEALTLISQRREMAPQRGWDELAVGVINDRGLALIATGDYQAAVDVYDRGLELQPHSELLSQNRRSAVMHWAEPSFSKHDYAEAIRRTTYRAQPGGLAAPLKDNVRYGYHQWKTRLEQAGRLQEAAAVAQQAERDPFLK